jgi:hypothetical protein
MFKFDFRLLVVPAVTLRSCAVPEFCALLHARRRLGKARQRLLAGMGKFKNFY